jgi:hypothetical protein
MNILALDIATATGFAYNQGDVFTTGTWKLASPKEIASWGKERLTRRRDPRVERLCETLTCLPQFDIIIHEDVQFVSSRKQAHLWAALRSAVWLCGKAKHFEAVDVQTLKKFAGCGGADKEHMSAMLRAQYPEFWRAEYDDNVIDAIWIWLWGQKNLGRIKL